MIPILVKDIMSRPVITISSNATMAEAVKIMSARNIGSIVVLEGDTPVGILTERDLLNKVLAPRKDLATTMVAEATSRVIASISPDRTLKDAAKIMLARKARLLVLEAGKPVGIVTASDLTRGLSKTEKDAPSIAQTMTKRIFMLEANASVHEAARLLQERRIGSVVITKRGKPFGIFTERDLVSNVLAKNIDMKQRVESFASHPLVKAPATINANEAATIMASHRIKRLLIFDGDNPLGIVTARDIVETYSLMP